MKSKPELVNAAYIWGAAQYGAYALEYCKDRFNIVGFVDRRASKEFYEFCFKPVITPEQFLGQDRVHVDVIIAVKYPADVLELLIADGLHSKTAAIYIFDGRNQDNPLLYEVENGEICVPEYMDKRFAEWSEYSEHYSKLNPYILKMFTAALPGEKVKLEKDNKICEIGCGSGQFANMLFDNGFKNYVGVDFSSQAIELAKRANPEYADKFICCDAFLYLTSNKSQDTTLFVMFEVLEHMNRDRELLKLLPSGSYLIFSVPNFKSFNHIRVFDTLESIQSRYDMLEVINHQALPASVNTAKIYHLVFARKKN